MGETEKSKYWVCIYRKSMSVVFGGEVGDARSATETKSFYLVLPKWASPVFPSFPHSLSLVPGSPNHPLSSPQWKQVLSFSVTQFSMTSVPPSPRRSWCFHHTSCSVFSFLLPAMVSPSFCDSNAFMWLILASHSWVIWKHILTVFHTFFTAQRLVCEQMASTCCPLGRTF